MDLDCDHDFENEQEFWDELENIVNQDCDTHQALDDALRSYLSLVVGCRGTVVKSEYDLNRCSYELARSPVFVKNTEYVRKQFVHCLLQEEELDILFVATSFLLADARTNERSFELLNEEKAFTRLVSLISSPKSDEEEGLHRLLMELFYEMARIQRIALDDLASVNDDFVACLFDIIEHVASDVNDPYHYPVIRILLVLNEQFMVAAHDPLSIQNPAALTNKVIKVLSSHGNKYKTFGENIILLLNREDETSLQLLTLKLLYLVFTTPSTYEYFYTNDLRVLVDILIRNLLDLPEDATALRHTYLRVFYPLLEHTQLQHAPYYKREEIKKLFYVLGGGQVLDHHGATITLQHWSHFDDVDETTKRLVKRCQGVSWLSEGPEHTQQTESPTEDSGPEPTSPVSPVSPSKPQPPALPAPRKLKKRNSSKGSTLTIGQYLTPQLESARQSSLSVMEMAQQKEKPGVITPSRNPSMKQGLFEAIMQKKEKPPPPKARRSGWSRMKLERGTTENDVINASLPAENPGDDTKVSPTASRSPDHKRQSLDGKKQSMEDKRKSPEVGPTNGSPASLPAVPDSESPNKSTIKKPPVAPRTRRWRVKGTKDELTEGGRSESSQIQPNQDPPPREPGKFDTKLPSVITTSLSQDQVNIIQEDTGHSATNSTIATNIPHRPKIQTNSSPFSPQEEKTLSPTQKYIQTDPHRPGHISSVSEALNQAQAQAISQIHDTIEKATTSTFSTTTNNTTAKPLPLPDADEKHPHAHPAAAHPHQQQQQQRPILAPPGQAPPRAVPGPEWELERSPFLSDVEDDDANDGDDSDGARAIKREDRQRRRQQQQQQQRRLEMLELPITSLTSERAGGGGGGGGTGAVATAPTGTTRVADVNFDAGLIQRRRPSLRHEDSRDSQNTDHTTSTAGNEHTISGGRLVSGSESSALSDTSSEEDEWNDADEDQR